MTVAAPSRSKEQRLEALAHANEVRIRRSAMKRHLTLTGAALMFGSPPWWLETMKANALLLALPGWGPERVRRTLRKLRVSETKTVGGLSERQRDDLAHELRENGYVPPTSTTGNSVATQIPVLQGERLAPLDPGMSCGASQNGA